MADVGGSAVIGQSTFQNEDDSQRLIETNQSLLTQIDDTQRYPNVRIATNNNNNNFDYNSYESSNRNVLPLKGDSYDNSNNINDINESKLNNNKIKESNSKKSSNLGNKCFSLYMATLPLSFIFLLDILPSRASLIFIGHLTLSTDNVSSLYSFNSLFMAYGFTNFFVVTILSLSCGLDTLSKQQLKNIVYLRHACILVLLAIIPYILACVYARNILYYFLYQPSFMIEYAHNNIQYLIGYCLCYVMFAMLRKSLLQYLNPSLLIGLMFARLCLHLIIGFVLYQYNKENLGFYCFAISDSISMAILLLITLFILSRMVKLGRVFKDLLFLQTSNVSNKDDIIIKQKQKQNRNIHHPSQTNAQFDQPRPTEKSNLILDNSDNDDNNDQNSAMISDQQPHQQQQTQDMNIINNNIENTSYFKEYLAAMLIPGLISCFEWWAVEAITFLVGGLPVGNNVYIYYFVHCIYASLLLIFQMPLLGLSVAMAAIMTDEIRKSQFNLAFYSLIQGIITTLIYSCIIAAIMLVLYNKGIFFIFFNLPTETELYENDYSKDYISFIQTIYETAQSINLFFIITLVSYGIGICLLSLFVSVGRLAKGGIFMLVGYYIFGVSLSVICGYVMKWHFYGIWFGYTCGFVAWALLSVCYWICCSDWQSEMRTMKLTYDEIDINNQILFKQRILEKNQTNKNYGSMLKNNNVLLKRK